MKIIIGDKFARLTILSFEDRNRQYDSLWKVRCDCGNEFIVRGGVLKNGHTQSCGCLQREQTSKSRTTHGLSRNPLTGKRDKLYRVFAGMKERCYNPHHDMFRYYGGSGVSICEAWLNDYSAFHQWAITNGYKEGLTIERVNTFGNYEPSNCKWIPMSEQSKNRRNNRILTFNGQTKKVIEWAEITSLPGTLIIQRIKRGWSIEKSLTQKPR